MERTIREVSEISGISRFTIAQVAREQRYGRAARRSGATWLIDMEHPDFVRWLDAHKDQPRVKGQARRVASESE